MKLKTDPFTRLQHIHHISKHATAGSNNQDEDIRASDTVECLYFLGLIASRVSPHLPSFLINCMEDSHLLDEFVFRDECVAWFGWDHPWVLNTPTRKKNLLKSNFTYRVYLCNSVYLHCNRVNIKHFSLSRSGSDGITKLCNLIEVGCWTSCYFSSIIDKLFSINFNWFERLSLVIRFRNKSWIIPRDHSKLFKLRNFSLKSRAIEL